MGQITGTDKVGGGCNEQRTDKIIKSTNRGLKSRFIKVFTHTLT